MSATARSISDLLMNQGKIAADAERERAGIAANARRDSAQIWATTIAQIGQQIGNLPAQMRQEKTANLEQQTKQMQLDATKRAQAAQAEANRTLAMMPRNEDGTYDTAALIQGLSQKNVPLDVTERLAKSIDGVNGVISSFNQSKNEHIADLANMILTNHQKGEPVTAEAVHLGVAAARSAGLATAADEKKFTELLASGAEPEALLKNVRSVGAKYRDADKPVTVAAGASLVRPVSGETVFTAPTKPIAPTPASLAMDAAKGDPAKALDLLNADKKADNTRADNAATETARHNRAVENAALIRARRPNASAADVSGLVDTVIANPALFDQLTPTEKGRIAPQLRAKGFDAFGKPLPPAAVKQIAESQSALTSLKDLREVLKNNEQYIGPLAGLQGLNPYSDARKAQANIDLVRQRVGKALEGGVLRKEDEEKYKLILATLRDEPTTAIYKVDSLIKNIEQDVSNFISQQRLSGRRVSTEQENSVKGTQKKSATVDQVKEIAAQSGKTYAEAKSYLESQGYVVK